MAINLLGIGGEPATGKSSILRSMFPNMAVSPVQAIKLVKYHQFAWAGRDVYVVGDYSAGADKFSGTDKLSMAVLPEFIAILRVWSIEKLFDGASVVFEGDRLFSRKLFVALREMNGEVTEERVRCKMFMLQASEDVLGARHRMRGDTQSASWLKGRATKLRRLCDEFPDGIEVMNNNDRTDAEQIKKHALRFVSMSPAVA